MRELLFLRPSHRGVQSLQGLSSFAIFKFNVRFVFVFVFTLKKINFLNLFIPGLYLFDLVLFF